MSFIGFDDAWVLWLLPLVLIPLLAPAGLSMDNGWLAFAPRDRASDLLGWALRAAASLALAALLFAMAGPHRPEYTVERVGQGAEIVLLLDRSRSMDQGFAPGRAPPPGQAHSPAGRGFFVTQPPGRGAAAGQGQQPRVAGVLLQPDARAAARIQGKGGAPAAFRLHRTAAR